jgi:hypothetical protein
MTPLHEVAIRHGGLLTALGQALAPWTHLYRHVTALRTAITYAHFVGILSGGGLAVAADRASLRLSPALPGWGRELDRLAAVHRWVVGGLALIFASGLLMTLAEIETFAVSSVFWIKMGLVALLLGNGYARLRVETALRQGSVAGWSWFRRASFTSLALWLLVLLAGALLHTTT